MVATCIAGHTSIQMTARHADLALHGSNKLQSFSDQSAGRSEPLSSIHCTVKMSVGISSQEGGGKEDSTPVDKACQSSEDEQVSEDDGFNARPLHLDSNLLTGLPQHSLVHLPQGGSSNGPL